MKFLKPILFKTGVTLFLSLLIIFTAVGQDILIDNGGQVHLASGTLSNKFISIDPTNGSTALLQMGTSNLANVILTSDLSEYYGTITFVDGSVLNLNPSNTTVASKIILGGFTAKTTLVKQGGAYTINGLNLNNNSLEIQRYGVLDLTNGSNTGDLYLSGSLYVTDYNDLQTGFIKFGINSATPYRLNCNAGKIYSNDPANGQINLSRHFLFDMKNAPGKAGVTSHFVFAHTQTLPTFSGTPKVINGGDWININVTAEDAGGGFDLTLNATLAYNTFKWNGNINTDWFTAGNWDSNAIPTLTDHAIIPSSVNQPVINGIMVAQCRNLNIQDGAKLTIGNLGKLTVNGDFTNNSGINGLVIESDEIGTGSMKILGTTIGSGTINRYMTADKWHLISSPAIQSVKSFLNYNLDIPILTVPVSPVTFGMRDYNTTSNNWNSYFTENIGETFGVGKGYIVQTMSPITMPFTFQGQLSSGLIDVILERSNTNGWNLIGNPYTSAINLNNGISSNNFIGVNTNSFDTPSFVGTYFWNDDAGKYDIINYSNPAEYLQSAQGFFVKAKVDGAMMSFTPSMQVHENTAIFKSVAINHPEIQLIAVNNDKKVSTSIKFIEGMTKGLDMGYDAGIFKADPSFTLYTRLVEDNGVQFQLQCLPADQYASLIIPVGLDYPKGGEVVFSAETANLPTACKVILEDKVTNTFTDLSANTYKAVILSGAANNNRFYLHTSDIVSGLDDQTLTETNFKVHTIGGSEMHIAGEVGDKAVATLFNSLGQMVLTKQLTAGKLNIIGLPNLSSGVYMLNIKDKSTSQTIKVLINNQN